LQKKILPYLLLVGLLLAAVIIKKCIHGKEPVPKPSVTDHRSRKDPAANPNRNRGFDRRISYIEYTQHAKCRMACRHITQAEVEDIMRNGTINYRKSDVNDRPCPTYAVEGYADDHQHLRIVFAQCDNSTKVVTCIDLDHEWECHCPGDDEKYKNRN
jgi:hypothetical protein